MRRLRILVLLAVASCTCLPRNAGAQDAAPAGVTMTPDALHLLVNKQLGAERWTISVNLAEEGEPDGGPRITSITGNVFRSDASDVSFVYCQVEPGSTGSLADPSSSLLLRCKGAGACAGGAPPCREEESCSAVSCARRGWTAIATGLELPAEFFLPPDGLWGEAEPTAQAGRLARWGDDLARLFSGVAGWLAERSALALPDAAIAQTTAGGVSMSLDLLHHLVVRDRSGQRWSIVLNMRPDETRAGGFRVASVTGNVFTETGEPTYVFCRPTADSALTLEDPDADLVFTCEGSGPCATSAAACAAGDWRETGDTIRLEPSFFLPDGGRGSPAPSDAELSVFGTVERLPAIASPEFHLPQQTGQPAASACTDGAACIVSRIGLCEDVPGRQIALDGTCHCLVDAVSPHCVRCGTEQTARIRAGCGTPCSFDVGRPLDAQGMATGILHQARGVCLPLDADSPHCFCHAIPAERVRSVVRCGDEPCASGECCIDDPRDGCRPLEGDAGCAGMCVGGIDGAGAEATCGIRTGAGQTCGDGVVAGSELCDPASASAETLTCDAVGLLGGQFECTECTPVGCSDSDTEPGLRLTLPDSLPQYGRTPIQVRYDDPDGDVESFVLVAPDDTEYRWTIPDAKGRASGVFEFSLGCNGNTAEARFDAYLVDEADNQSVTAQIALACTAATTTCGNGMREDGEACDSSADGGSGCEAGTLCANDCSACNPADSCRGRCCPGAGTFCAPADQCACDPECGTRADCCADSRDECGF
jgi:hypothetical protein